MSIRRRQFLGITVLLVPLLTVGLSARAKGDDKDETKIRWDIVSVQEGNLLPGGIASARNNNNDKITVTGSGTFVPGDPEEVTGGGTFLIVDSRGREILRGTYRVTKLVSFELAPGEIPPGFPITDTIGDPADARSGLVYLRVRYSDGRRGILVVGCELPAGTPPSVMEGITAAHVFSNFWNREAPQDDPFIDANRTVFHVVREAEDR